MSRYFSEAMNNHPEFQRLRQRIKDLENGTDIKELQEQIKQKDKEIYFITGEVLKVNSEKSRIEDELKSEVKSRKRLMEQMKEFNSLSRFCRLFYRFNLD